MKILAYSDLHIEFDGFTPKKSYFNGADITVQVGDIHSTPKNIHILKSWDTPVIFVPGNHDFWNPLKKVNRSDTWSIGDSRLECPFEFSISDAVKTMKKEAINSKVTVLYNDSIVLNGVRFVGSTLWYPANSMSREELLYLNDYRRIYNNEKQAITSHDIQMEHDNAKKFLEETISTHFNGPTVLLTHHPARKIPGIDYSIAYGSDLDYLWKDRVDLFVYGHAHEHCDIMSGKTRVISNPRGYPGEKARSTFVKDFVIEI